MNIFKKIYCRIYQLAFRAAMPILPYREPKILSGIEEISSVLKGLNINSVLLVTDGFLRSSGLTIPLEEHLSRSNIKCVIYDKTRPNPTIENAEEARSLYKNEGCNALIAFGGGSAIDCAKAVGAMTAYPKKTLRQLKGLLRIRRKLPTLIAIPTTAGTGSEVTVTAVITDPVTSHKYTMNSFSVIPHYAVLDPKVTYTLPPSLTATTGMDALTHAVEAYIGRSTSKETRALAEEAVGLVFQNIETAYNNGSDYEARKNMLHAAYKAGLAFSKSYVGYIHAVAHSLGGQYNIPHGLANAVLMPIFLEAYGSVIHKKLYKLALYAGVATKNDSVEAGAKKFIEAIKELNRNMNVPEKLDGIKSEDISIMAKHADKEANPLYPVPIIMNAKELEVFYRRVAGLEG